MAVSAAKITPNADTAGFNNKRIKFRTLTFSGNYATGGEAISATALNLRRIDAIIPCGPARSSDLATANPVSYNAATGKMVFYESGASGAALAEKTDAEAYPTGSNVLVIVIGN